MTRQAPQKVTERLLGLIEQGHLSDRASDRARKLLENIDSPVRIAAIGRRASGKTSVLNALLGDPVVPYVAGLSVLEISHHVNERFSTSGDASHPDWKNGQVTDENLPTECDHVVQQLTSARFEKWHLTEITLPEQAHNQERTLRRMANDADIVMWCTRTLDDQALSLWANMPDDVKDHSFLVLTHADELLAEGTLSKLTDWFQKHLSDDFMCLYPIASKHALAACQNGEHNDPALWKASGGQALVQGIANEISQAHQALLDQAELLLVQHETSRTVKHDSNSVVANGSADDQIAHSISPMKRSEVFATALTVLQSPVEEMLRDINDKCPDPSSVLEHSAQAAQALATLFMDANTDDSDLNTFRENILEYEQMALLLQLEGTEQAASDAVGGLLQLKKEMSEVAYV